MSGEPWAQVTSGCSGLVACSGWSGPDGTPRSHSRFVGVSSSLVQSGGGARDRVEAEGGGEAAADAVVVAADVECGQRADDVDDLVGAGAVADHVAEVPDGVVGAGGGFKDSVEGFEIAVDVGEDEGAHCVRCLKGMSQLILNVKLMEGIAALSQGSELRNYE